MPRSFLVCSLRFRLCIRAGDFKDDFDWIATNSPELSESLIQKTFVHIGNSDAQKNLQSSLKRVQEMNTRLYHGMARHPDKKHVMTISMQRASQSHEKKKKKKDSDVGEKGDFKQYMVVTKYRVEATTVESHGHTLGEFVRVVESFCVGCTAGRGGCYHQACSMYTQLHHWGEERQTAKPSTIDKCPWVKGSKAKRRCDAIAGPLTDLMIENLSGTSQRAACRAQRSRQKNIHLGLAAVMDPFGSNTSESRNTERRELH